MTIDEDVEFVVKLGRRLEDDYKYDSKRRNVGREKPCLHGCGGVMWLIDGKWICGDCRQG